MNNNQKSVYVIALFVILLTVGLDQWTKYVASSWLATERPGGFSHTFELDVPTEYDGKTLHEVVEGVFGDKNTPEELARIERSIRVNDAPVAATYVVKADQPLTVGWREITVIPNYWDYQYTRNNGAAFSFLADTDSPLRTPFFVGISLLSVLIILYLIKGVTRQQIFLLLGLSLVCGGAIGNLIDRISYGYVIDFIVWKYTDQYRWPTFNVADAAICVGVAFLIINMIQDALSSKKEDLQLEDSNVST